MEIEILFCDVIKKLQSNALPREEIADLFIRNIKAQGLIGELTAYLESESLTARELLCEENLAEYILYIDICNNLKLNTDGFCMALGDFYLRNCDTDMALKLYGEVFKPGFDLYSYGYFYSLESYISLLGKDGKELLKKLLSETPASTRCEIDLPYVYILLLSHLNTTSKEYETYLEEGLGKTYGLVRDVRKNRSGSSMLWDTDEERALCELLSLKLLFCKQIGDCKGEADTRAALAEEINLSGCLRYHHVLKEN